MVKLKFTDIKKRHERAFKSLVKRGVTNREFRLKQHNNYENIAKARGMILTQAIELEEFLNFFLADYFASDARANQFSIIFPKLSSSEMWRIIRRLTKSRIKDKEAFLTQHFAHDNKESDFQEYFLPNISLKHKAQIFIETGYFASKQFKNKYSGLDKLLVKLIDTRNLAAHGIMVDYAEPKVKPLRIRGKWTPVKLDDFFIERYSKEMTICITSITQLTDKVWHENFRRRIS